MYVIACVGGEYEEILNLSVVVLAQLYGKAICIQNMGAEYFPILPNHSKSRNIIICYNYDFTETE